MSHASQLAAAITALVSAFVRETHAATRAELAAQLKDSTGPRRSKTAGKTARQTTDRRKSATVVAPRARGRGAANDDSQQIAATVISCGPEAPSWSGEEGIRRAAAPASTTVPPRKGSDPAPATADAPSVATASAARVDPPARSAHPPELIAPAAAVPQTSAAAPRSSITRAGGGHRCPLRGLPRRPLQQPRPPLRRPRVQPARSCRVTARSLA